MRRVGLQLMKYSWVYVFRVILDIGGQVEIDLEAMKQARQFYMYGEKGAKWEERFRLEMEARSRAYSKEWRCWGSAALGIGIDDGWTIREVPRLDSCRVDKHYRAPSGETSKSLKQLQTLKQPRAKDGKRPRGRDRHLR